MTKHLTPPAPIRTDESNAFANNTMKVRVPAILQQTLDLNPDYNDTIKTNLKQLRDDIAGGAVIPPLDRTTAPDYDDWLTALQRQQTMVDGALTWHNAEWFFAETYTYRRLNEATHWYQTGRDPFLPKKLEEIEGDAMWTLLARALDHHGTVDDQLLEAIAFDLWGNRIDLSYEASLAHGTDIGDDDLLVDHRSDILAYLHEDNRLKSDKPVMLIADNAGSELAMDLVLIDVLLAHVTDTVYLHVKSHPTFVSDVVPADVWMMLDAMQSKQPAIASLAKRLLDAWQSQRLVIVPHPFWNSSMFMWELPATLLQVMNTARLIIVKGDANYRRVVGDAVWRVDAPFSGVVGYMDAPVLCLRTLKSDPIVGLPSVAVGEQLDVIDPQWRFNGKRGVIQFKR